ncbi:hypothetical protein ACP275_14G232700 [Erythranthe tilingii]
MEYLGRRVRKEFQGRGAFFGSIQAYTHATGVFKITYTDGVSEELSLAEVHPLLVSSAPSRPPLPPPESSSRGGDEKRRRITGEGKVDGNSVVGCGVSVDGTGNSMELDLNSCGVIDLDDDCGDHGRNLGKLHAFDLNEGLNFELHEGLDLNKGVAEEGSGVRREMIDLNLDAAELVENVGSKRKVRWFDLNVELKEDDVIVLDDDEDEEPERNGDKQKGKELTGEDGEKGNQILNMENKQEIQLEKGRTGVNSGKAAASASVNVHAKRRKTVKEVVDNKTESDAEETIELDPVTGKLYLKSKKREEASSKKASNNPVDCVDGGSGSAPRGRRGTKRTESSNSNIALAATPQTGLRRVSPRVEGTSLAGQGSASTQLPPPTFRAPHDEKMTGSSSKKPEQPVVLPPKVELPPSSGCLDLSGVPVFDMFSIYAFLMGFCTFLLLSPFKMAEFVTCVESNDSTLLFDSIHFALLRALRINLQSLSSEGSKTASNCLRSINWNFLDLITWPEYAVRYLLMYSPGYIPGLDRSNFEVLQRDYYELPVSAKVEILRHLCDDVVGGGAFRSEMDRRTLTTEQPVRIASTSCATGGDVIEPTDDNGDECCLCKMGGNLICCDGCPAAFHSRCVGVVSSQLPEGEWYCPECSINKDRPWNKMGKSIRGAESLGTDPYGRRFHSCCDYLLVSESCNDEYSFRFYERNDLHTLIGALQSSPFIYGEIISAICKHWNVSHGFDRTGIDLISPSSYFVQSASHEKLPLSVTPSEALDKNEGFTGKKFDEKSTMTTNSSNIETETSVRVNIAVNVEKDGVKIDNQLASSEGSAEVSQAFTKTEALKEGGLDCSKRCTQVSGDSQIPGNPANAEDQCTTTSTFGEGKNISSANYVCASSTINSTAIGSQVPCGTHYVNCYEFAQTASSIFRELTAKSTDKTIEGAKRSAEENVSGQLKLIFNRFAQFSWSNMRNSNVTSGKEKCGWCSYCKVPEDEMDCSFVMNDNFPALENFTTESLDIGSTKRKNHLIDVMCHIICMEDHLQGLLVGPWLNPNYSQLWRKSVLGAADLGSIKTLLLELESNLHHLAVTADWKKSVDSASTMGSACLIAKSSRRVSLNNETKRTRAKCSKLEITQTPKSACGLRLLWWKGDKASRELFNCKVLPRSLASKAARQGGFKKISGVQYPESGDTAKRTRYTAWRAAVETSKSVEKLALQVRELDAHIRWGDIGNKQFPSKQDKESKKPIKSFKKVIIRKKSCEGEIVRYLLDFGRKRCIPDIAVKHGSLHEDSSSESKQYWLEDSHVPLHLIKAFEEKKIARKSSKTISGEHNESSRAVVKPLRKKGLEYLFERAERLQNHQCGHCKEDVNIREAVSCQYCKGFFHKIHAHESGGSSTAESTYTCHECQDRKVVQVDAGKGKTELPKRKKKMKAPKPLDSKKGKAISKEEHPVDLKTIPEDPVVAPARGSVRNAERISKLVQQSRKIKKRKRNKRKKDLLKKLSKRIRRKKRTPVNSSYWLNGLHLSRRTNDDRVMDFRSKKLLLLCGEAIPDSDEPKCSLCGELEYTPEMNYVACEICRVWFHGDALGLTADKINHIFGFKCHNCLEKRPLICPNQG